MAFETRDITTPHHHHHPHHYPHDINRVRAPSLQGRHENRAAMHSLYIRVPIVSGAMKAEERETSVDRQENASEGEGKV